MLREEKGSVLFQTRARICRLTFDGCYQTRDRLHAIMAQADICFEFAIVIVRISLTGLKNA